MTMAPDLMRLAGSEKSNVVRLVEPSISTYEWIPFGANHMLALNNKLGSSKPNPNRLFTAWEADTPNKSIRVIKGGLTDIYVQRYSLNNFVHFDAEIAFPAGEGEDGRVEQDERFGVTVNHTGALSYHLKLLEANDVSARDGIWLDDISRVLVDVVRDSSRLMQTLLTPYQQNLLNLVFFDKSEYRDKFYFIHAKKLLINDSEGREVVFEQGNTRGHQEEISGTLRDGEAVESELQQIVEQIQDVWVLDDGALLVRGVHGAILVADPDNPALRPLAAFALLSSTGMFKQNLFTRIFAMNEEVVEIQNLMTRTDRDPTSVPIAQAKLVKTSSEVALLEEVNSTLKEAVWSEDFLSTETDSQLARILAIEREMAVMKSGIVDLEHIVNGTKTILQGLRDNINAANERRMHQVQRELQDNTRNLEDITRTNDRTGSALQFLQYLLAATLMFEIVGMFVGEWSAADVLGGDVWDTVQFPGVLFAISIVLSAGFAIWLIRRVKTIEQEAREYLTTRVTFNEQCDVRSLAEYIDAKRNDGSLLDMDGDFLGESSRIKVSWVSKDAKWRANVKPSRVEVFLRREKETEITLSYDEVNGFLLNALVEVPKPPSQMSVVGVRQLLREELEDANIVSQKVAEVVLSA